MLAPDDPSSTDGTVLDPVPEGMFDADGVMAPSGVSSEDSDGEPVGDPADGVPGVPPLHWLIGGVCTRQAPGSCVARVWFIVIPKEAPLLSTEQRH